jgi:hypothetical protein
MLNNNFNFHTPWNSQNPYNSGQAQKEEYNNFQHYNILSAYEVKDETFSDSIFVSLVFYHMVRSKKTLLGK